MILTSILLALTFTTLDVAVSTPLKNEKIETVDISYFCFLTRENEADCNKTPVLLIHGLGSSSTDWNSVYEVIALGTGRRVCVVDLRNHGDSPRNSRSDVAAMAADIAQLLNEKEIQKVNIVGHSIGGQIAIHYTLNNPDRVDSIVVEDMRPNGVSDEGYNAVKRIIQFERDAIKTVPDGLGEDDAKDVIVKYLRKKLVEELGFDKKSEEISRDNIAIRFFNGSWEYKADWDILEKAFDNREQFFTYNQGLYEGPALFLYGTKSFINVKADEKNITRLFPKAQLVPVEGAEHTIHRLHKEFNDEVIKFLNKV